MSSTHAHDFLDLIGQQQQPLDLTQLAKLAVDTFGADVRFHTCRLEDQNIEQMLTFFVKMEKVVQQDAGYVLNRGNICNH